MDLDGQVEGGDCGELKLPPLDGLLLLRLLLVVLAVLLGLLQQQVAHVPIDYLRATLTAL